MDWEGMDWEGMDWEGVGFIMGVDLVIGLMGPRCNLGDPGRQGALGNAPES
jgi:hypothetical protein